MRELVIRRIQETLYFSLRFLQSLTDERLLEIYKDQHK